MEINQEFKNIWKTILEYNGKRTQSKEQIEDVEVRIPLTPIDANASVLYLLSKILYPKFISDQQNILDIVISQNEDKITHAFLYKTKKSGVHDSLEKIPLQLFNDNKSPYQNIDLKNKELLFTQLQQIFINQRQVKISSIRVFKENIFIAINNLYSANIYDSTLEYYRNFFNFVQEAVENELIWFYPKPNVIMFLEDLLSILSNIRLSELALLIGELLPQASIGFLIGHEKGDFLMKLSKGKYFSGKIPFEVKITPINDIKMKYILDKPQETMNTILKKEELNVAFQFQFKDIISIALDLFGLDFPLNKEVLQLFAQKILFGLRSYENRWFRAPRIALFNLKRFFLRILGLNLNIKKLSHWSIPTTFFQAIFSSFGLNAKILVLFTDIHGNKGKNNIMSSLVRSILFDFENGALRKIHSVNKDKIIIDGENNSLAAIRFRVSEIHGTPSLILKIDKLLLTKIIHLLVFQTPTLNFLNIIRILKLMRNDNYFNTHPKTPFITFFKNSGSFKILKVLSSIVIDKHEF
ncbi:MAG: hypothetical protein JW891_10500 [Candidatus Lokiarchaeota archaeon]|nr:hypothetical protein [Candidatus Lokiarchaeota archaeon]